MNIFLTHQPSEIDEIYSWEAVNALREIGEVIMNPHERYLSSAEMTELAGDAAIIISEWNTGIDRNYIEANRNLKAFVRCGVEILNVDFAAAAAARVIIANTPGLYTYPVVEYTFGLMLAINRKLVEYATSLHKGIVMKKVPAPEFYGKTIAVIGLGAIGRRVASVAHAYGMKVLGVDPFVVSDVAHAEIASLDDALRHADYVTMHAKWSGETAGLLGRRELALMKPSAFIINTARGALIDEDALYEALADNRLAGAALDVFATEPEFLGNRLLTLPNVLATPHIAGYSPETLQRQAMQTVEVVKEIVAGKLPVHTVNRNVFE